MICAILHNYKLYIYIYVYINSYYVYVIFCILYAEAERAGRQAGRVEGQGSSKAKAIEHIELAGLFIYIIAMLDNANKCYNIVQTLRNQQSIKVIQFPIFIIQFRTISNLKMKMLQLKQRAACKICSGAL